jgi:hypothetical protein
MLHEYHATMAMQEHHRRVGVVSRRHHLHPRAGRASWWARLRRRVQPPRPAPPAPAPVALPGVRRRTVMRVHPALEGAARDGQPG